MIHTNSLYFNAILTKLLARQYYAKRILQKFTKTEIGPLTDKFIYSVVQEHIKEINKKIIKVDSSFNAVYRAGETVQKTSSLIIFNRLINRLYDKAKELGDDLYFEENLGWCMDHHENLMIRVLSLQVQRDFALTFEDSKNRNLSNSNESNNQCQWIIMTQTKQKNMDRLVKAFVDLQVEKFAHACGLTPWQEYKEYIVDMEDFQKNYNSEINFIRYLINEIQICKYRGSDGPFTKGDVFNFAKIYRNAFIIEVDTNQYFPPFAKSPAQNLMIIATQTKEENMYRIVQTFIDLQVKKFADEHRLVPWEEHKEHILDRENFQKNYNSEKNFIRFLEEIKIFEHRASDGFFTENDVFGFVETCRYELLLEADIIEVSDDDD